jgi:Tfp pilus assembly protein PilN
MIKINLVPAEILAKAKQRQLKVQATLVGIVLVGVLVLLSMVHVAKLERLKTKLAKDQDQLKKLEKIVAEVDELEKTVAAVRSRLNVITDLLKGRELYPAFMSDFVRSVPPGVMVRTLNSSGGGSAATPLKLTISASARSNNDIASWVHGLEDSGKFSDVELGDVTQSADGYGFSLSSKYVPKL